MIFLEGVVCIVGVDYEVVVVIFGVWFGIVWWCVILLLLFLGVVFGLVLVFVCLFGEFGVILIFVGFW